MNQETSSKPPCEPKAFTFGGRNIEALFLPPGLQYRAAERTVVVNLSPRPLRLETDSPPLRPWRSTSVRATDLRLAEPAAILRIKDADSIGRLTLDKTWRAYGTTIAPGSGFPPDTPLWISPQDEVMDVKLDPRQFTGEVPVAESPRQFRLKLNLWYAPPFTDCFIHTGHKFLEVHTQIHGTGRMQKFRQQDTGTLYEEVRMSPGFTHESFAVVDGDSWRYPWHRYYADTDCIWLAIELHAA
jgi:hypothetical protein